jgi:hypothetical protein
MTEQPSGPPTVSPDGRWWWDGSAWQPMPSAAPPAPAVDEPLYDWGTTRITRATATFGPRSYPISSIASFGVSSRGAARLRWLLLGLFPLFMAGATIAGLMDGSGEFTAAYYPTMVLAAVVLAGCVFGWTHSKPTYFLTFTTASSEAMRIFTSKSEPEVRAIAQALEKAVAART